MFSYSKISKNILYIHIGICILLSLVFVFLFTKNNILDFYKGIFIGILLNFVKMLLLEKSVNKAIDMDKNTAALYAKGQYILRYILTFFVLAISANLGKFFLFGSAAALISLQIAVYIVNFLSKDIYHKDSNTKSLE